MRLAIVARPKPDANRTLPLYVRVEHGGVTRYVSLGLRIPERDWNPKKREVRASHANYARLNKLIAGRLSAAQDAALTVQASGRLFSADRIRDAVQAALNPEPEAAPEAARVPTLSEYFAAALEGYEARGQVATAYAYRSGVTKLEAYAGRSGASLFEHVTPPFVRGWLAALRREHRPNTVHKYVAGVRTMTKQAAADKVPGAAEALVALQTAKLSKESAHKARLSFEQVQALEGLERSGRAADARDWYVFAFYVGGMRFSDVALLRWRDVDRAADPPRVRWRQKKTAGLVGLPVLGFAADVLTRWHGRTGPGGSEPSAFVFGLLTEEDTRDPKRLRSRVGTWNALANAAIYEMQREVGAPVAGFHSARHSFADHLRKSGLTIYDISKALGHGTFRQTQTYLADFDAADLDAKLGRAFG